LPFSMSRSASVFGTAGAGLVLTLGGGGDAVGLVAGLADHPLACCGASATHPVGVSLGVGQQPIGPPRVSG